MQRNRIIGFKPRYCVFYLLFAAALMVSCRKPTPPQVEVNSVSLSKTSLSLTVGDVEILTVTVSPTNATDKNVTWESTNPQVVTVDNGMLTAVNQGEAIIIARVSDKKAECKVQVSSSVIPVSSISVSPSTITLAVGDEAMLYATVEPTNASDQTLSWVTSNPNVAAVTEGKVTAQAEGHATITVMAGDKRASCEVIVQNNVIKVVSVALNKSTLILNEGDTETLTAKVLPENATDKTVTWSSSDSGVANVVDGVVTAIKAGTAIITARAGGQSASCEITVLSNTIEVSSIVLNMSELTLVVGKMGTLVATVLPNNATDKTVTWNSSNSDVATVENGQVQALKEGVSSIVASAGGHTATCQVTVIHATSEPENGTSEGFDFENW